MKLLRDVIMFIGRSLNTLDPIQMEVSATGINNHSDLGPSVIQVVIAGSLTTQFPLEAQPEVFKEAALLSSHFEWRIMVLPQF